MSQISDQNILLKAQLSAAGGSQSVTNNHVGTSHADQHLQSQVQNLIAENSHQKTKITFYESENSRLIAEVEALKSSQSDVALLKAENYDLTNKVGAMGKDQEDLLELLADQDLKLREYRRRLRALGQQVEQSDDEN